MNDLHPQFERAEDRFLGLTKTQFAGVAGALSLFATAFAVVTLVVSGIRIHQGVCQAVDTVNSSIRVVLERGIAQGERELKNPAFAKYKADIEQAISQDKTWEQKLFFNRSC